MKTIIQIVRDQAKRKYNQASHLHQTFNVGDKVLLQNDNIAMTVPSHKLAAKFLEPYMIIEKISHVLYRLKLPKMLQIHDIFHVSLLEKYLQDTIVGSQNKFPPPIISLEGDIKWQVQEVLNSRLFDCGGNSNTWCCRWDMGAYGKSQKCTICSTRISQTPSHRFKPRMG